MMSTSIRKATNKTYVGLFLVTLATLFYELLLTRIFSVTMWYHFAFMAVSLAMFGLTVGGLLVYLRPNYFTPQIHQEHRLVYLSEESLRTPEMYKYVESILSSKDLFFETTEVHEATEAEQDYYHHEDPYSEDCSG